MISSSLSCEDSGIKMKPGHQKAILNISIAVNSIFLFSLLYVYKIRPLVPSVPNLNGFFYRILAWPLIVYIIAGLYFGWYVIIPLVLSVYLFFKERQRTILIYMSFLLNLIGLVFYIYWCTHFSSFWDQYSSYA